MTASSRVSSRTVPRTVTCVVSCSPSSMNLRIRSTRNDRDRKVRPNATAVTAASEISATHRLVVPRNTATAMIGSSSPTAPAARTWEPSRPCSRWFSRRMGSSVPSAVVVSAMATGTNARTSPTAYSRPTIPPASAAITSHDRAARRPGSARSSRWSTSYPARRNRKPSPTSARICALSGDPSPRPCGPIRIPPRRSRTICGIRGPGSRARQTGASTATTAIMNSVPSVECTSTASSPLITRIVPEPGGAGQCPGAGP